MKVVFRADGSSRIGLGHVTRCVSLALALQRRGVATAFICRSLPGPVPDLLARAGMFATWLPTPADTREEAAPWSLVAAATDASETADALEDPDWLVVDHYGLDHRWERSIRPMVGRILSVDDLHHRYHDVDVLLDQNLDAPQRPIALVDGARQLLGPNYALLRPEFAEAQVRNRRDEERGVLVFLGGGDVGSLTLAIVRALVDRGISPINVVLTSHSASRSALDAVAAEHGVHMYVDTPDMAALMAASALMIGSAGSTSWERCATGLPAITVSLADNQAPVAAALARRRVSLHLGSGDQVEPAVVAATASRLLERRRLLERMSRRAVRICDGRGASRVAEVMIGSR